MYANAETSMSAVVHILDGNVEDMKIEMMKT